MTELARRLGLHKSTASRLLATLEKRGLVEQDEESGKYRLGLVVIRLAETAEQTLDLRSIAMPELDRLARATARPPASASSTATSCSPSPRPTARTSSPSATGPAGRRPAPLRRGRQGPPRVAAGARDPAPRPARPRPVHGPDDHRPRAAPRGAGSGPPARLRDGVRRVRPGLNAIAARARRAARSSPRSTSGARRSGSRRPCPRLAQQVREAAAARSRSASAGPPRREPVREASRFAGSGRPRHRPSRGATSRRWWGVEPSPPRLLLRQAHAHDEGDPMKYLLLVCWDADRDECRHRAHPPGAAPPNRVALPSMTCAPAG